MIIIVLAQEAGIKAQIARIKVGHVKV